MMKQLSEEIRLRHQYRKLILQGKVAISRDGAKGLVGPDCAFHLYARGAWGRSRSGSRRGIKR